MEGGARAGNASERRAVSALVWGLLAGLLGYLAAMYGGVMRVYLSPAVALRPWLLFQPGFRLYSTIITQHPPGGMWLGAALSRIAPHNPLLWARAAMIAMVAAGLALVFWLARRWWGGIGGVAGALLFAGWAPVFLTYLVNYDALIGLLAVSAAAVWHRPDAPPARPALAGLITGLALIVKPQVLAVIAVFLIWRALAELIDPGPGWAAAGRDAALFLAASAIPLIVVVIILAADGRLDDAVFWIWEFSWGPYAGDASRLPDRRELAVLAGWLALLPLFAFHALPRRESWRGPNVLLLGLLPALATMAFPRYGRFHLGGAVPIVALLSAGAVAYTVNGLPRFPRLARRALALYLAGGAALLIVAFALPTYYRVKLGPLVGEYGPLVPVEAAFREQTGAEPGARVWVVTEIDPTDNFYVIGGYLPPALWVQIQPWKISVPGVEDRLMTALSDKPPAYAVVFEQWRPMIPPRLTDYLDAHYTPVGSVEAPAGYGAVTFYQRAVP
jgi:hypothetical protein